MRHSLIPKTTLFLIVTVWFLVRGASAQTTDFGLDFTMRPGETRLEGTILKIDKAHHQFVLEVDVQVSQDDTVGDLTGPGRHIIIVDKATTLGNRRTGDVNLTSDNLLPGSEAIVIGQAAGAGKTVHARLVAVSSSTSPPAAASLSGPLVHPGRLMQQQQSLHPTRQARQGTTTPQPHNGQRTPGTHPKRVPRLAQLPPTASHHKVIPSKAQPTAQQPTTPHKSIVVLPQTTAIKTPPAAPSNPPVTPAPAPAKHVAAPPRLALMASPKSTPPASAKVPVTAALPAPERAPRVSQPGTAHAAKSSIMQGLTTYATNPKKSVRADSTSVPVRPATTNNSPLAAAPPHTQARPLPTPPPHATLNTEHSLEQQTAPTPKAAPLLALNLPPQTDSSATSTGTNLGHATNPITAQPLPAPIPPVDSVAALSEVAHRRFQARQITQNEIHYAYFSGGSDQEKLVALTFDDGPNPVGTKAILDILKQEHVPATFFVIGRNAEKYPELIWRALAEGHDIGNHTYHHRQGAALTLQDWRDEIERTNEVLIRLVGAPTRWFRAPGCHYTSDALQAIQELGMVRVDTTNNSSDWDKRDATAISQSVLERLAPGNVILLHDPMPQTARALPHLIHEVRNRGYRFVLLGELAQHAQATPGFQPVFRPEGQGIVITK
ncbi:MAG: polysaccharide deacetylase family protein [Abitibacteriaceae bacterium]|nr:polysaccharide deacetylase family protein [Abditibacteriaceae bacterium]MBV9865671.1 polysaccharide deacetylase family protein [Abditibacteriaceae bacterium]